MTASPRPRARTLAVVIPMYNEEAGAETCVREVCRILRTELPESCLFVVNDGSRDGTAKILARLEANEPDLPLRVVSYEPNRGYGAALLEGARAAEGEGYEFALFMDSDLTNPPSLIRSFHDVAAGGNYDVIKASRYVPGGGMSGVPWNRRCFTIVGNKLASVLFGMGIHDCTNGFRAVRLSLLRDVTFHESGFPSIVEELFYLKQKRARATEIPYLLTSRQNGGRPSAFHYTPKVVYRYLKYAIKAALV